MKINSDFSDLLSCLNQESVEYLLVGGYAVILHSEPRYTKDIDVWIHPTQENSVRTYRALTAFGAPLAQLGLKAEDFQREGYFVQLGREPARVDLIMGLTGIRFEEAWANRIEMELGGVKVPVISRDDLINAKLEAGRPQDLIDAKTLRKSRR